MNKLLKMLKTGLRAELFGVLVANRFGGGSTPLSRRWIADKRAPIIRRQIRL